MISEGFRRLDRLAQGRRLLAFALASTLSASILSASILSTSTLSAGESTLVARDAVYSFFRGTEEPSPDLDGLPTTEWTEDGFDDSAWEEGAGGFGYGDQLANLATEITDMQNGYWSLYYRHVFEIEDVDSIQSLQLDIDYDDGFIAYLNGVEIARSGLTGEPPAFTTAAASHESGTVESFEILDPGEILEDENVLAVTVHNTTLGSSDCIFIADLVANPGLCPQGLACAVNVGTGEVELSWTDRRASYDSISVLRDDEVLVENIGGNSTSFIDDDAPLGEVSYKIIAVDGENAACPDCEPLSCTVTIVDPDSIVIAPGDTWSYFKGIADPDFDWNLVDFDDGDWLQGPTGIGYGDGDDATVLDDMANTYASVFVPLLFDIDDAGAVESATLEVIVDDGLVLYVNGDEVTRINMPADEVTSATFAVAAAPEGVLQSISIDPTFLVSGENVIAASVHNTTIGSSDLSFIPTLVITGGEGGGGDDLFRRGDIDANGGVNLTDAIRLLDHLFRGQPAPPCADAADVDDNGALNLTDAIRLLGHLFRAEPAPPAPGTSCGVDPTADLLGPCSTTGC